MLIWIEVRGHSTNPLNSVSERHSAQIAAAIIAPLVVGAAEAARVTARRTAHDCPAMSAPIDPRRQNPVRVARYYHRCIADEGALEVVRKRNFGLHPDEAPNRAAENPLLLKLVDLGRAVDLVRNPRAIFARETDQFLGVRGIRWLVHLVPRSDGEFDLVSRTSRCRTFRGCLGHLGPITSAAV